MSAFRNTSSGSPSSALLALVLCLLLASCAERDRQDAPVDRAGDASTTASVLPPPAPVSFQMGEAITSCNIETVNGTSADGADVAVDPGQDVFVEGWVLASETNTEAESWTLHLQALDGRLFAVTRVARFPRPDLVGRSSVARSAQAGFRAEFRLPEGADGRMGLFLAPTAGSVRPTCALGRGIVAIRP